MATPTRDEIIASATEKVGQPAANMTLRKSSGYWANAQLVVEWDENETDVELHVPDPQTDDADDLAQGATVEAPRVYGADAQQLARLTSALAYASKLLQAINDEMAELVAAAKAEAERLEQLAQQQRAERERQLEERKERLMVEFLEEKGSIRLRGMKRWRPVTVMVQDQGDGNFVPFFRYHYDKHGWNEHFGGHVRAFKVKVGSRYQMVWDDGQGDLNPWDRKDSSAPAYDAEAERI